MNKKINFMNAFKSLGLIATITFASCNLDIEETDSLITPESAGIFNGLENVEAALTQLYNTDIQVQVQSQENIFALNQVSTDETLVPTRGTDWGDNSVWRSLHTHTWDSQHRDIINAWRDCNRGVLRASEIIDPLSKATPAQLAQAKFARAFNMWYVMDLFGQVPFRNPTDGLKELPEVMSRTEAYAFVVKDLEDAIKDLPADRPIAADKARPDKSTARFFLAKVLLNGFIYKGESTPASAELDEVISLVDDIESAGYALTGPGTYFDIFVLTKVNNTDVIWNSNAEVLQRIWNGLHYSQTHPTNTGGGWNGFCTLAEFYDSFEDGGAGDDNSYGGPQEERRGVVHTDSSTNADNLGFGLGFQFGQMYGWVDGKAVKLKDRSANDLVFTKELPALFGNNERTGIRVLKYSPGHGDSYNTRGLVMARYADAHLMRAEARFRKGEDAAALADVNALRAMRKNTPPLASLSLDELLAERGRELYEEGWRRNDLIRFNKFTRDWDYKDGESAASKSLFPIPEVALLSNPGLEQNPGY